ncbi:MAG: RNA polymerase sigma factor [Polyangiaceae bacterium]
MDHESLFRREAPRLIAALVRLFGVHHLELAEDVVQDAFCRALERWDAEGAPENPGAWLMTTAKRRALDVLRRRATADRFGPELGRALDSEWTLQPTVEEAFSDEVIQDEQLRLMFSCCHPDLSEGAQLALVLNVLCGLSAPHVASALLLQRAAAEKRIARGKQVLAAAERLFDLEHADFAARLATVTRSLYLLFNEGYHSASSEPVRLELCADALRLTLLLKRYAPADTPTTSALAALMCLHAARLPCRVDPAGDLHGLADQDRQRWDWDLVAEGLTWLRRASSGTELSAYHLEAAIAATHAAAKDLPETDWGRIVQLYDRLLRLNPSPMAELGRAVAIGWFAGPERGLAALDAITDVQRLTASPFYGATRGELEALRGDLRAARRHLGEAIACCRNDAERRFLEKRLAALET